MILLLSLQVPAKALGSNDSYIRTLRTLNWSLVLNMITVRPACATRLATCSVKMPLLQLTKLSKIVTAILRLPLASRQRLAVRPIGHILPMLLNSTSNWTSTIAGRIRLANGQRLTRQYEIPSRNWLPYQPLAISAQHNHSPPVVRGPWAETQNIPVRPNPVKG